MLFRKIIFWIHLISGLVAGIVVAVMSITGIAIAFEEEILDWIDRDLARVEVPENGEPMRLEELIKRVRTERPDFPADYIIIPRNSRTAYQFMVGYGNPLYVDPYTGSMAETKAEGAHDIIHVLEVLHRFFGLYGENTWLIGRYINGAANLAFLLLCVTGLYIWIPRVAKWRIVKKSLLLDRKATKRARDWNWHNVFGIWSLPGLFILSATAVVISYEWGHKVPFLLFGEEPPKSRNFGMMAVEPARTPEPAADARLLPYNEAIQSTRIQYADWVSIGIHLPEPLAEDEIAPPLKLDLVRPDYMPSRAWAPVEVDPYTGEILQIVAFQDRSPGLRARVWTRFIHTGAGFGIWGKIVASVFTAGSLFLVYTGFALSYRRFFGSRRR